MNNPNGTQKNPAGQAQKATSGGAESQPKGSGDELKLTNIQEIEKKHPELVPLAKQLQADYTRKTQEIAGIKNKAKAFEEISKDPKFQSFVSEAYGLGNRQRSQPKQSKQENKESIGKELGINLDDELVDDDIKKVVKHYNNVISSLKSKLDNLEAGNARTQNDRIINQLEQQYPGFKSKMPELLPLINKGYDPEAAYLKKFGKELINQKTQAEIERLKKEETESIPPNVGGGEKPEPASQEIKSLDDAISFAQKEVSSS